MEIRAKLPSRVVNAPGLTWLALLVVLGLMALAPSAHAELSSKDVIDLVLQKYQAAAAGWETAILNEARWLFWKIALLSLVVLISFALLTRPEGVVAEIARWVLFTGVFYWALDQGPAFARGIINSMRTLGSTATGTGKELYPSDILDIGFKLWQKSLNQFSLLDVSHIEGNFLVCLIALLVLLMTAWVVKNIVELVCAAWVVLYAGSIFLAFGAAPFFRDIALSYYRTMLAIGAALMTMEMIIGIGTQFLQSLVAMMGDMANPQEMTVIMVAAFVLAGISHRLPNMVAGIIGGSHGVGHSGIMTALAFGAAAGKIVAGAAAEGAAAQSAAAKKAQPTMDAIRNGQRAAAASDQASSAGRDNGAGNGQGTSSAHAGDNGNGSTPANPYLPGGR